MPKSALQTPTQSNESKSNLSKNKAPELKTDIKYDPSLFSVMKSEDSADKSKINLTPVDLRSVL